MLRGLPVCWHLFLPRLTEPRKGAGKSWRRRPKRTCNRRFFDNSDEEDDHILDDLASMVIAGHVPGFGLCEDSDDDDDRPPGDSDAKTRLICDRRFAGTLCCLSRSDSIENVSCSVCCSALALITCADQREKSAVCFEDDVDESGTTADEPSTTAVCFVVVGELISPGQASSAPPLDSSNPRLPFMSLTRRLQQNNVERTSPFWIQRFEILQKGNVHCPAMRRLSFVSGFW